MSHLKFSHQTSILWPRKSCHWPPLELVILACHYYLYPGEISHNHFLPAPMPENPEKLTHTR